MSKNKRYRAAGRHWINYDGTLTTSPFPGAKTVEDVGRMILCNRGKADRYRRNKLPARAQTFFGKLRKSCIGGEFKRLNNMRLEDKDFAMLLKRTGMVPVMPPTRSERQPAKADGFGFTLKRTQDHNKSRISPNEF